MAADVAPVDLHVSTPSVYLDQWVWIRLARAANGTPREASDVDILAAVRGASAAGVAFPLSSTHYIETRKITDPRQRADLARIMASVSHCRTLRSRRVLLRQRTTSQGGSWRTSGGPPVVYPRWWTSKAALTAAWPSRVVLVLERCWAATQGTDQLAAGQFGVGTGQDSVVDLGAETMRGGYGSRAA